MKNIADKIKGCFLGGAVGDALGYAVEFYSEDKILETYGKNGITDYALCGGTAMISDDTQMTVFTADGVIRAAERGLTTVDGFVRCIYESYRNWLYTQDKRYPTGEGVAVSALLQRKEFFSVRAPGCTCLSALRSGRCGSFTEKINDSKGCGGVMRIAPVALLFAQKTAVGEQTVGQVAARAAAITHTHPLGYIPAAFAGILLCKFLRGNTEVFSAVEDALVQTEELFAKEGVDDSLSYFRTLIERAVALAQDKNIADDLDAIRDLGEGWVAEETVAIAVYCTLRYRNDFERAIVASVNHGGDSDSTGAVTGNLMGALLGCSAIPERFLAPLELRDVLENLSDKLCALGGK